MPAFWQIKCVSSFFVVIAFRHCRRIFGPACGQDLLISQYYRLSIIFGQDIFKQGSFLERILLWPGSSQHLKGHLASCVGNQDHSVPCVANITLVDRAFVSAPRVGSITLLV